MPSLPVRRGSTPAIMAGPNNSFLQRLPFSVFRSIVEALLEDDKHTQPYRKQTSRRIYTSGRQPFPGYDGVRSALRLGATCKYAYNIAHLMVHAHDRKFNYTSALLISAKRGNFEGIVASLDAGADVNAVDRTTFETTYRRDDGVTAQNYIQDEVRTPVYSSMTSLHWAALHGNETIVRLLIKSGANVNQRADLGYVSYLPDSSGPGGDDQWQNSRLRDDNPLRPLLCATAREHLQMRYYSNSELWDYPRPYPVGANALFFALKCRTDPADRPTWERPMMAFHRDIFLPTDQEASRYATAKFLIEAGSSLTTRVKGHINALHQASAYCDVEIARFLVGQMRVDANIQDDYLCTPCHYLTDNLTFERPGKMEMARFLFGSGADPALRSSDGMNAEELGWLVIVERYLLHPQESVGSDRYLSD